MIRRFFWGAVLALAPLGSLAVAQPPAGGTARRAVTVEAEAEAEADDGDDDLDAAADLEADGDVDTDTAVDVDVTATPEPREVDIVVAPEAVAQAAVDEEAEEPPPLPPPPSLPSTQTTRDTPTASSDVGIPLQANLHGYYRARYMWLGNVPQPTLRDREEGPFFPSPFPGAPDTGTRYRRSSKAHYAFQRLRLLPEVTYGRDPENPVAALYMQFDGLDNVVFGDNARIAPAPLFANDPSGTDIEGFDVGDSIRLERAWLQFLIPVGQIRVGRMPSQWGMGLLSNDGNGLGEWGDPLFGTTYDRILFATRPLSIINAITKGDSRPTPLVFAIAYDKLVEDPVTPSTDSPWPNNASWGAFGPYGTQPTQRSSVPFAYLSGENNDVNELATAIAWADDDFGPRPTDELRIGFYYVYRWQNRGGRIGDVLPDDENRTLPLEPTSRVHILDWYYKVDRSLGPGMPSIYSEAELTWITGRSNTIPITGACGSVVVGVCNESEANVWGGAFRAGVRKHGFWGALVELGFSSGDSTVFGTDGLTARALHPDHHVGLLMYQVALQTATAIGLEFARPLWSRGGVWNSWYLFPQARVAIIPGIEVHAAFLTAYARELVAGVHQANDRDTGDEGCGALDSDCWMGWEADFALRVKWGENDLLNWDTEVGVMGVGKAFRDDDGGGGAGGFGDNYLWTVQSRMGLIF